jgi:ABC-type transporter Mla subunit MlaD
MKDLTKEDIKSLKNLSLTQGNELRKKREQLWENGQLTQQQFNRLTKLSAEFTDTARKLNNQLISDILTDIDKPREQIEKATDEANKAISKLESMDRAFENFANILNVLTVVFTASNPVSTAVVQISKLLRTK